MQNYERMWTLWRSMEGCFYVEIMKCLSLIKKWRVCIKSAVIPTLFTQFGHKYAQIKDGKDLRSAS